MFILTQPEEAGISPFFPVQLPKTDSNSLQSLADDLRLFPTFEAAAHAAEVEIFALQESGIQSFVKFDAPPIPDVRAVRISEFSQNLLISNTLKDQMDRPETWTDIRIEDLVNVPEKGDGIDATPLANFPYEAYLICKDGRLGHVAREDKLPTDAAGWAEVYSATASMKALYDFVNDIRIGTGFTVHRAMISDDGRLCVSPPVLPGQQPSGSWEIFLPSEIPDLHLPREMTYELFE